ncbi:MAG: ATP synthase F1 subunit gamma [Desulfobacterales bacterium]|nr:ATP synthase F1 subunit gamma [Desulfobacterales bacterium]
MPSLKDVEMKISAVKKTRQITKAMNMVAASRLRGAQSNMDAFRPYAGKFGDVLGSLAEKAGEEASPLLMPREEVRNVHIVLFTSDRGLCGGFNTNLQNKAKSLWQERKQAGQQITMTCFGKKARTWARKYKLPISEEYIGVVGGNFEFNVAANAGRVLIDGFLEGTYDEVHLVYSQFLSMAKQQPTIQQLLPIPPIAVEDNGQETAGEDEPYLAEHICEPSPDELLDEMLPRNISVQIYNALLETSTAEHAARMMAMDNATKACNDMLENLTMIYNKARQAAITSELMDIVGGAEALRG